MPDNRIPIPGRMQVVDVDGIGLGADEILDDDLRMKQSQINAIILGDAIKTSLAASPSVAFVGTAVAIALTATSSTKADTITIKKGSTVLATGANKTSLTGNHTLTPSEGNNAYTAEFVIGGLTKNASQNVTGVYPIRIGSGAGYVDGTAISTPKTSPAGTYTINVANDRDYVYLNVPATMTISKATMSGFDFPLESPQAVTIGGVAYKSYRSGNTYYKGTITVVLS